MAELSISVAPGGAASGSAPAGAPLSGPASGPASGGGARVRFAGRLVIGALSAAERALDDLRGAGTVTLDLEEVTALDTAGAWLLLSLRERLEAEGAQVEIAGLPAGQRALMDAVAEAQARARSETVPVEPPPPRLAVIGRGVVEWVAAGLDIVGFLGLVLARIGGTILRPRRLRLTSLVHHMEEVGLNAVPIVGLMAFLIGVVLAFQGATQLRQFGAEVFVVDLIAISILRELGILLTAIIVAGRSGSAFTASIGSMKVNEEVDAMRALSLDPIEVLVLPRIIALVAMLPILGFIADIVGLFGGALMSWLTLGVSPGMFVTRLYDNTDIWHYAIGMIKAPVFALIIGVVGCHQGFQVGGSAESVGRRTTSSVVISIFMVIVADALFSIFFAEMEL